MQFQPSSGLRPFVKNYSLITVGHDLADEVFYPSGYIDLVVKIAGNAATTIGGLRKQTPGIELLGHLTVPTRLDVAKGTCIIIARLLPFASRMFFRETSVEFTNRATDLSDVLPGETPRLYDRLMSSPSILNKVRVLDTYLAGRLRENERHLERARLTSDICQTVYEGGEKSLGPALSRRTGYSNRHIQNLFRENVGLSPVSLLSVKRFNRALDLMRSSGMSLTSIALACRYYDQAHFIKEFRRFTQTTPSDARVSLTQSGEEFQQAVNIGF